MPASNPTRKLLVKVRWDPDPSHIGILRALIDEGVRILSFVGPTSAAWAEAFEQLLAESGHVDDVRTYAHRDSEYDWVKKRLQQTAIDGTSADTIEEIQL